MQNPLRHINNKNRNDIIRYSLLTLSALIVLLIIPKKGMFKYEYEQGKPWMHEDLTAPFTFAIQKPQSEITGEQNEVSENFSPFYERDAKTENDEKNKFIANISLAIGRDSTLSNNLKKYYISTGVGILSNLYKRGIINMDSAQKRKSENAVITEIQNNVAKDKNVSSYLNLAEARNYISDTIKKDTLLNRTWFIKTLWASLSENVIYDKTLSDKKMNELMSSVSPTKGVIKQGEKVISRGSIITPERYEALESLKNEYENNSGKSRTVLLGYILLLGAIFVVFGVYIELYHKDISSNSRGLILILINILFFIGITTYLTSKGIYDVYMIPYCIVPIVLMSFFGIRIAMVTHFLLVFLCGLIVPNPFEFAIVEIFAGATAVLTMSRLRYISQFFISAFFILLVYCVVYSGISLIKINSIQEFDWRSLQWFGANFVLTLLAYPLVYANEKIFGFVSDISLIELSDVNNTLLKELFQRAPGTFQHSLQVSNLVETVLDQVGGNALLARVGALYHDIGKLHQPEYFIENMRGGINPHALISEPESAEIIIAHVSIGVQLARENKLPKRLIDFIRTHHGTTRVEYFYRSYLREHEDVDEMDFRYPGPKPATKEMAVLMIVDSVEAASRSLRNHKDEDIENLVDHIIDSKISDHQFDHAPITIREINAVRRILKKLMKNIHHVRIQYPR
jgi:putative nucleotidyltransferase with HDIG domain